MQIWDEIKRTVEFGSEDDYNWPFLTSNLEKATSLGFNGHFPGSPRQLGTLNPEKRGPSPVF